MVLMMMLMSHDADISTNGVTLPKSHVAPHFDHLDLTNAVKPLMMLSASSDTSSSASGVT